MLRASRFHSALWKGHAAVACMRLQCNKPGKVNTSFDEHVLPVLSRHIGETSPASRHAASQAACMLHCLTYRRGSAAALQELCICRLQAGTPDSWCCTADEHVCLAQYGPCGSRHRQAAVHFHLCDYRPCRLPGIVSVQPNAVFGRLRCSAGHLWRHVDVL
jgi:hypothetical protein